jgi:hypothetical protein
LKTIKLMADYHCHPLWHVSADVVGDIDPSDLPISSALRAELADWAQAYDETLNMDAPQNSGFSSEASEESFKAEGRRLAECLRQELGSEYILIEQI